MQLSFFPEPLPDEPLYSLAARYHRSVNYSSYRDCVDDLFGRSFVSATVDLPSRLSDLALRLPWENWTVQRLISGHTSAPYFSFLAKDLQRHRLAAALSGTPPPSGAAVLGAMTTKVKNHHYLRYCPVCVETDRQTHTFAYWHRAHQLPGVMVCSRHHCALADSPVTRKSRRNRHAFYDLECALQMDGAPQQYNVVVSETMVAIAHDSAWILHNEDSATNLELCRAALQSRFRLIGWMTSAGSLRAKTLRLAWEQRYPLSLRTALRCGIDHLTDPTPIVRSLIYGGRCGVHPLLTLLILRLIGQSPEILTAEVRSLTGVSRQSDLTGTCVNALCPDYGSSRGIVYKRPSNKQHERIVCCSRCGMQYYLHQDSARSIRIVVRGELWDDCLRSGIAAKQQSLRQLARKLGVDPTTVKRHAQRLNLSVPWNAPAMRQSSPSVDHDLLGRKRIEWTRLRESKPSAPRKELRRLVPALWAWLYRNDREWFFSHQPTKRQVVSTHQRVDWDSRDRQLSLALVSCVRDVHQRARRPIRVTRAELARRLGNTQIFRNSVIRHLPRTARTARRVVESTKDFAERRIAWAVDQYRSEATIPERWQLVRRAGLRPQLCVACAKTIDRAIQTLSRDVAG